MADDSSGLWVRNYLVSFLDVLGQRDQLRRIASLPRSQEERDSIVQVLAATYGFVREMRRLFGVYFTTTREGSPFARTLGTDEQRELRELLRKEVSFRAFSDSFVVAVPLMEDRDFTIAMNSVYTAIVATCGMPLVCLVGRHALRGGLDIGVALPIGDDEVYGPALERAYTLESECAHSPRVAVGEQVQSYLRFVAAAAPQTRLGEVARQAATRCERYLFRDSDGQLALDFLGEEFRRTMSNAAPFVENVPRALAFVREQCDRWAREGNDKLLGRYQHLLEYFESRQSLWIP
jgi:hypothetical protein